MYDVIVIGGGPSGSSCAAFLSKKGRKVLLLDRATFPRDKTCGDGISGRSVGVLNELGVYDMFSSVEHMDMFGVTFSAPNGTVVPVTSEKNGKKSEKPPGFVCRRMVFDNVLFQYAKSLAAKTVEGFTATDLIMEGDRPVGVKGQKDGKEMEFRAKIIVGADGAAGITARKLGSNNTDPKHQAAGIRTYYENVDGMIDQIELHFVKEGIPGYFWIFPLPDKKANVGMGMLVSDMQKKKINLSKVMEDIITNNRVFKERFKNAKRTTEIKSWLLPFATKKVKCYGNGYLLVGDAASLIDPFTGEGIGNALTSGKVASEIINEALDANDFTEGRLSAYQEKLYKVIGSEVNSNYRLQQLGGSEFLLNMVIGKAKRSKDIRAVISDALIDPDNHKNLYDPVFLFKALIA